MKTPDHSMLIYVVEDNDWYNKMLCHTLELNPEFQVESFFSGSELKKAMHKKPDVVTLDYRLPDAKGEELLKYIQSIDKEIAVIVISEQEDLETAVSLLRQGAFDYLTKSKDIRDRLLNTISHILKTKNLENKISSLQSEIEEKYDFSKTIIGASSAIKNTIELAKKALGVNITVSLHGETGTGKEVLAKAIHYNSERKSKNFIAVNMAAIPHELAESELFGHEKGAFTGANNRRIGKFEAAQDGTLFLDEIGELSLQMQQKLLRVLQEREIVRVGGNDTIKVNCRIIVATHKNLAEEVEKGNFREDLFYRLKGLPIELPPVRSRGSDVILLAQHFLNLFAKENKLKAKSISSGAKNKLLNYSWPGNVREVKSVIELAAVLSSTDLIEEGDISLGPRKEILPNLLTENLSMREYNQRIVLHYMSLCDQNTKTVAEKLGIGQTTVYRLLNESKNT